MKRIRASLSVLSCLPVLLVACTALPDVQPFADATAKLQEGLEKAGSVTLERVAGESEVEAPKDGDPPSDAWELQQLWETRLFAAGALVSYSEALAQIVDAGQRGSEAAAKLGGAVAEIGGQIPGVGVPSATVVELAQKLVGTAIKVKASRDLARAVQAADPAVSGIADLLVEDLDDLWRLYEVAHRKVVKDRYIRPPDGSKNAYKQLRDHRKKLEVHVAQLRTSTDLKKRDERDALRQAEELLALASAAFAPHWERRRALDQEREEVKALFEKTKATAKAWKSTHADLASAIEEGRQPNWRAFLRDAQELYELVEAVQKENSAAEAPLLGEDLSKNSND